MTKMHKVSGNIFSENLNASVNLLLNDLLAMSSMNYAYYCIKVRIDS